jgi:hypothetical protein
VLFSQELLALPLKFRGNALDLTIIPNTGMILGAEIAPSCLAPDWMMTSIDGQHQSLVGPMALMLGHEWQHIRKIDMQGT